MSPFEHPISDGSIIESVLSGRTERFAELVTRYEKPLLRLAKSRLGRDDWAEDVVQETFYCAFKSLASYDSRYAFRTWLWTILLNQCRRRLRKQARTPRVWFWSDRPAEKENSPREVQQTAGNESPPQRLLAKERSEQLDLLLKQLPENQADALRLRFFGGLKFHEIAEAMGCSLSSAKNRVRWGLSKMSQMMVAGETP